jgi:hypothetical protein
MAFQQRFNSVSEGSLGAFEGRASGAFKRAASGVFKETTTAVESTVVWDLASGLDRNGRRWFSSEVSKQPTRRTEPMADNLSMALAELLRKADAEPEP